MLVSFTVCHYPRLYHLDNNSYPNYMAHSATTFRTLTTAHSYANYSTYTHATSTYVVNMPRKVFAQASYFMHSAIRHLYCLPLGQLIYLHCTSVPSAFSVTCS